MVLNIPVQLVREMKDKGCKNPLLTEAHLYNKTERIEARGLTRSEFDMLRELADNNPKMPLVPALKRTMKSIIRVTSGVDKGKITDLRVCAEEIRMLVGKTAHRWIFEVDNDTGITLPYIVNKVWYEPEHRTKLSKRDGGGWHITPPYVGIRYSALSKGHATNGSGKIHIGALGKGVTALAALESIGVLLETPELIAAYEEELDRYADLKEKVGTQFLAVGSGDVEDDDTYYRKGRESALLVDGKPGKVVLDDEAGWGDGANTITVDDWSTNYFKDNEVREQRAAEARRAMLEGAVAVSNDEDDSGEDEDSDEEDSVGSLVDNVVEDDEVRKIAPVQIMRVPEHPFVRVFSLHKHFFTTVHISCLRDYFYRRQIFDKLILPPDIKTLIDALVEETHEGDDIIEGKGKGAIILLFGPPGNGKTLSAEAYSEKVKKPLYSVQCAQLGTTAASVEKELVTVLHRAERWGCLLLIDEADVYIHERGTNVEQNAMVGVFLRVLEYYKGVLFLTTNREGHIDDAIASRCIAEIRYDEPNEQDARRIWEIMFAQYSVKLATDAEKMSAKLVSEMPNMSGRTIKHTTRLANLLAARAGKPAEFEHFVRASQFQSARRKV